jgi:hypothetical protein
MPAAFEARTDRAALRAYLLRFNLVVALLAAVFAAGVGTVAWAATGGDRRAFVLFAAVAFAGIAADRVIKTVRRLQATSRPGPILRLTGHGLRLQVPQASARAVTLPWSAIGAVRRSRAVGGTMFTITLAPGVERDHPGAEGLDDPVVWRALTDGPGLRVGTAGLTADATAITDAIARLSRGKVDVQGGRSG